MKKVQFKVLEAVVPDPSLDKVLLYTEKMLQHAQNRLWLRRETVGNVNEALEKIIVGASHHIDGISNNLASSFLNYFFSHPSFGPKPNGIIDANRGGIDDSNGLDLNSALGKSESSALPSLEAIDDMYVDNSAYLKDSARKNKQKLEFALKLSTLMKQYDWVGDHNISRSILWLLLDNNLLYLSKQLADISRLPKEISIIDPQKVGYLKALQSIIVSNCFNDSYNLDFKVNGAKRSMSDEISSDNIFRRSESNIEKYLTFCTDNQSHMFSKNNLVENWLLFFKDLSKSYSVFLERKGVERFPLNRLMNSISNSNNRISNSNSSNSNDKELNQVIMFPATICEASLRVIDLAAKNSEFDIAYPLELFSEIFNITRPNCNFDMISIVQEYICKLANRGFEFTDYTWIELMKCFYKFGNDDLIEAIIESYLQYSSIPKENVFHHITKSLLVRFSKEPHRAYRLFMLFLDKKGIIPHLSTYRIMAVSLSQKKAYRLAELVFNRSMLDYGVQKVYASDSYPSLLPQLVSFRGGWLVELCSNSSLNDGVNFSSSAANADQSVNDAASSIEYYSKFGPLLQHFVQAAIIIR